jgi:hypothetical protein
VLLAACLLMLITGVLLLRVEGFFEVRSPLLRRFIYWTHVSSPLIAGWLYWLHRLAGPRIRWQWGVAFAAVAGAPSG